MVASYLQLHCVALKQRVADRITTRTTHTVTEEQLFAHLVHSAIRDIQAVVIAQAVDYMMFDVRWLAVQMLRRSLAATQLFRLHAPQDALPHRPEIPLGAAGRKCRE